MPVTKVTSDSHFYELLSTKNYDYVLVDFYADWCGPCLKFAPTLEKLSQQFPRTLFLKVNVDECEDVSLKYNIKAMPTFLLFESGSLNQCATTVGADENAVFGILKPTQFVVSDGDF